MSGSVSISRGLFDSEAFRAEPLTEREAWIWILMEASWKDRVVRAGDHVVPTSRGQLAASVRFMAKAWKWTAPKVQRYLKRLQKLEMIRVETDTGVTLITVCNYDKYQLGGKASDTGPIQGRYRIDTNEKKDERREEGKKKDTDVSLPSAPPPLDEVSQAVSAYNGTAERVGWPQVQKLTPNRRASLKARLREAGGATGWECALAKAEASSFLTGRTNKPFTASFDWIVKQSNFTKIMEGNYDDRTPNHQASEQRNHSGGRRADHDFMAAFAKVAAGQ